MGKKKLDSLLRGNDEIRAEADSRLWGIQTHVEGIESIERIIAADILLIRERYAEDLARHTKDKANAEKALKKFALKNKEDLFGPDGDKVSLPHGIILYAKEDKVTIPKDAVERIEELGWKEGIKIVKNIDRPVIEKWTDEKLAAIGASKKPKESITWELTNVLR